MAEPRKILTAWVKRVPVPVRLIGPPALIALALLVGPDLFGQKPEQLRVPPESSTSGVAPKGSGSERAPGSWTEVEEREYAALASSSDSPDAGLQNEKASTKLECIIEPNQVVALGSSVKARIEKINVARL